MRKILFFILLLFGLKMSLLAQTNPISFVVITPPHSTFVSDFLENPDLFQLQITNLRSRNIRVKVGGRLIIDGNVMTETNVNNSEVFELMPGLNILNVEDAFEALLRGDLTLSNVFENVLRTGQWPAGVYQWCFDIQDADNGRFYFENKCVVRGVTGYSPPNLIMPLDGFIFKNPVSFIFRWSSVIPGFREGPVNYNLKVFDIKEGQNPTQALQTNFPIIDQTFLNQTVTTWPPEVPLEPGKFIWTVQATDMEGRPIGLPDSYAQPFIFTIKENVPTRRNRPVFSAVFPSHKSTVSPTEHLGQNLTFNLNRGGLAASNPNAFFNIKIASQKPGQTPKVAMLEAVINNDFIYQSPPIPYDQTSLNEEIISMLSDTIDSYVWKIELDYDGVIYPSRIFRFFYETPVDEPEPEENVEAFFTLNWPTDGGTVRKNVTDGQKKINFDFNLGSLTLPPGAMNGSYFKVFIAEKSENASEEEMQDLINSQSTFYESRNIPFSNKEMTEQLVDLLDETKLEYMWQVRAFLGGREFIGPVYTFSYDTNPVNENFNCSCVGADCLPEPVSSQIPAASVQVGDIIKAGNLEIEISSLDGSSGSNTIGTGKVKLPFAGIEIKSTFSGLQINEEGEVFSGELHASQYGIFESLGLGDDLAVWEIDQAKYDALAQHLESIGTGGTSGIQIPFSLNSNVNSLGLNLPFDLVVTDILFKPEGNVMNLLMVIPAGDGQFVKFGAEGIGLRSGGVDMSELKLFLAEDTGIPGLGDIPFKLKAAIFEDPLKGSYVQFDCNGLKEFNLQGEATFPKEMLVKTNTPDEGAVASLTLNMSDWSDIIAGASFENFTIPGLDNFEFNISEAFIDKSSTRNVTDIVFPEGYEKSTADDWTGFYLKNASILAPQLPGIPNITSNEPFQMIASNMIIDSSSVSGTLMGVNLLNLNDNGAESDWQFAVDTLKMSLTESTLAGISAMGKINMPLLKNPAKYAGSITKKVDDLYRFDLAPVGDIEMALWRADLMLLDGSKVTIDQTKDHTGKTQYNHFAELNAGIGIDLNMDFVREHVGDVSFLDRLKEDLGVDVLSFELPQLFAYGFKINHPNLPIGEKFSIDSVGYEGDLVIGGVSLNLRDVNLLNDTVTVKNVVHDGMGLQFKMSLGVDIDMTLWSIKDDTSSTGWKFGKIDFDFAVPKFSCVAPEPAQLNGTIGLLQAGGTYNLGDFPMRVQSLPAGNTPGVGVIRIPYLGADFQLKFGSDLQVNSHNQVIAGQAYTVPAEGIFSKSALVTEDGVVMVDLSQLDMTENFINTIRESAETFNAMPISLNRMVSKIAEIVGDVEIDLPFDVVVTGFTFDKDGGKINAMALVEINGHYPKLGVYGMQMSPTGIALDNIKLYLIDDL